MSSHLKFRERLRRHDLVFVNSNGWRRLRRDLAAEPLVALWADKGWPLVARRRARGDLPGVPLGLPLPPSVGRCRLSLVVHPEELVSSGPPHLLSAVRDLAPPEWWPTLDRLDGLAPRQVADVRVFGSLLWQAITGLSYLSEHSDLDVLLHVHAFTDLDALTAGLADIAAAAPMRIDGELVREDGAAVNWREWHKGAPVVLVKKLNGVSLIARQVFVADSDRS